MFLVEQPGWIVLILCVAGVLAALVGLALAVSTALHLLAHLRRSANAPVLRDTAALSKQLERLSKAGAQAPALLSRANTAIESIRADVRTSGIPRAVGALKSGLVALRLLIADLS